MKLLEAQPEIAPGAPPAPPAETPPEERPADPGARTCKSCGATMQPGQDWCLACGTASGRAGGRPGARSAMTLFRLTALLVLGAVGASFAALSENHTAPPSQNAAEVAQVPPAATTAPPAATATTPPASTTTTPADSTSTGNSTLPKVRVPATSTPARTPAPTPPPAPTPAAPRTTTPPA